MRSVSEIKSLPVYDFDLKDDGSVVVAFSKINEIDRDEDVTLPGAIPTKNVPMSDFGHSSWPQRGGRPPVGLVGIKEEETLGIARGSFFLKTDQGRNAYETVKGMGDHQEWSFGFDVKDSEKRPKAFPGARRALKSLDIYEISPVLIGSGRSTGTLGIKELELDDLLAGSFSEQADRVLTALKELHVREEDIIDLRLKEGRAISGDRRARLTAQRDLLAELLAGHEALLTETEPKPKEGDGEPVKANPALLLEAKARLHQTMTERGYRLT